MSVANQKTIIINKTIEKDFLQVENSDWMYAFEDLTRSAFGIYLYLAKNQNGYKFEYSPQAIANTGMMAKGTASDARKELIEKGYIVDGVFYARPPKRLEEWEKMKNDLPTADDF